MRTTTQGATYAPLAEPPALAPAGARSFTLHGGEYDFEPLIAWLQSQGFERTDPRSKYEFCRLRDAQGRLVVVYHSSTVLVQGSHQIETMRMLARLVGGEVRR
jgi:hypothetical protein